MSIVTNQSIAQIEEQSKEETIQKYQSFIDKFNGHGCKLNIEFSNQSVDSSKIRIHTVKTFILPLNISKNEALKNCKIKCFSGKLLKIKKKENNYYVKNIKICFCLCI